MIQLLNSNKTEFFVVVVVVVVVKRGLGGGSVVVLFVCCFILTKLIKTHPQSQIEAWNKNTAFSRVCFACVSMCPEQMSCQELEL